MHAFDVLADPVRRRILELLALGEHASGEVVEVIVPMATRPLACSASNTTCDIREIPKLRS